MASALSPAAMHRILICLKKEKKRPTRQLWPPRNSAHYLEYVNSKWKAIYELYAGIKPAPPHDYLYSLELSLVLKGQVNDDDVRAIFAHGKPLQFWGCPRLLVSKILGAFTELQKEPEYLEVAITALDGLGTNRLAEAWPQAYRIELPCYACTTVEIVEESSIARRRDPDFEDPVETVDFAVEKFHVSSKSFNTQLTVELHYLLDEGEIDKETEREQSSVIHKITIRLANETCSVRGRQSAIASRSSASMLLLPDFASEVFGCLDRAHVGSSLLASRGLHDLICKLKQRLPVHHLRCTFDEDLSGRRFTDAYWFAVRHIQRDLAYADVRRFKMPTTAGVENDCALIRRYLNNSHMADLRAPDDNFDFAIKMLASLAARNFSVGRVELYAGDTERLCDYRSMNVVFGGMQMSDLDLSCHEHRFVEFVKTTDFFRMPTIQGLRTLKLDLSQPWNRERKQRGHAKSKSPLWVSGIYLLRNCEHYRVDYRSVRHLRSIERKVVQICEDFELGKITDTVKHFDLRSLKGMHYAFNRDNLLVSGMRVGGEDWENPISDLEWDVYRFRNASTSEYLTACVGRNSFESPRSVLRISKGEVYPDASFAYLILTFVR